MSEHLFSEYNYNNIFPSLHQSNNILHKKHKTNEISIIDSKQEKHLRSILAHINPQRRIIKTKDKSNSVLKLSIGYLTSNSKNEGLSNRSHYNTCLTNHKRNSKHMSSTNNSLSYQFNSDKKNESSRNKILSLDCLNINNISRSIPSNSKRKPVIILKGGLQHERASVSLIDQKQTEADTSFDRKIPLSNMSSLSSNNNIQNKYDMSLDGIPYKSSIIRLKKLSNIPEDSILSKRNFNKFLTERANMTHDNKKIILKSYLRAKTSITHDKSDMRDYGKVEDDSLKAKYMSDKNGHVSKNSYTDDDNYSLSESIVLAKKANTTKLIQHISINCERSSKCLLTENNEKLLQLASKESLDTIDSNRNGQKQIVINSFYDTINIITEQLLSSSLSKKPSNQSNTEDVLNDLKQYLFKPNQPKGYLINYKKNNSTESVSILEDKLYYTPTVLNITIPSYASEMFFEKYQGKVYHKLLTKFLNNDPIYKRHISLKRVARKKALLIENKLFLNKHLEGDFSCFNPLNTDNIPQSPIRIKNRKPAYNTVIHKFNPFFQKILNYNNSVSLTSKISKDYYQKMSLQEKIIRLKKNHKPYTLLKNDFYSRDDFDVQKLKEVTDKMQLIPRCKAKNIKFKIVDEQEEIKKNKNMSKESLIFRTQEIKLKIKEKLKTIEEILFFLIKELNFKEFKKLLEQYQVDLESKDNDGNTYLIFAVECSFMECVVYLIQKGSDINAQNYKHNTPLHIALMYQNYDIADLLLRHGAAENILNKNHMNPWQCLHLD